MRDRDGADVASRRWIILGVLFLARTAMGFQFQSVVGVSSSLRAELGIGLGDLGILVGAYMLPGIIVAILGGSFGRRFGEKRIAVLGLLPGAHMATPRLCVMRSARSVRPRPGWRSSGT